MSTADDLGRSLRDGLSPSVEPASSLDGSATSIPSAIGLFPFTLYAEEGDDSTSRQREFRGAILAALHRGLIFSAYVVVLHSPTNVRFTSFGMRDSCFGVIGMRVAEFSATVSAECSITANVKR